MLFNAEDYLLDSFSMIAINNYSNFLKLCLSASCIVFSSTFRLPSWPCNIFL